MKIEIKEIRPEETWMLRHTVMWPDQPFDFVKLPEDDQGLHFGLFVNENLTSIVSIFINEDDFQFRKLATKLTEQGKGYGSELLQYIVNYSERQKANRLWCNARSKKADYYERFGLEKTEKTYQKGGIDFVIMEKIIRPDRS